MSDEDEGVDFPKTECLRETERAILVSRGKGEIWVPKSVLHDDSEVYEEGDYGRLVLKTWWAEDKGLI